ncbi:FAD-dependent monooxygenase [Rugosimonospora acidiphila]|uniref:FAD-dependent monooxygenase n=1 Tax=Rugosimonospora acidiphila TaxID=556531 RepID=A0ABP9SH13_9ACTN
MNDLDVLVVGAGPAGLMLACELGLAGVRASVIEAHPRRLDFCRGFNLNARSLDLLALRGIAEEFLAEGPTVPATTFSGLGRPLDLSTMDTDHRYALGIAQTRVEELLEQRAGELGVPVRRGRRLTGLHQDAGGVTATVRSVGLDESDAAPRPRPAEGADDRLRAGYLVGCDGGRSTVRKLAGIAFPGTTATRYTLLGDVALADPAALPFGPTVTGSGAVFVIPRPGYVRILTAEPEPPADRDAPVTLPYLQETVDRALGRHVRLTEPRWLTRFGDAARQAQRYVEGRILLAGDAAHIHPPAGAVGVNVAIDDAMNLGWKLAATVRGWAPHTLLETYHSERHAAGELLLRNTRAQALLGGRDDGWEPVRELFADLAAQPAGTKYLAELVTGVGTRYPMPALDARPHPWLGRMAPNLRLTDGTATTGLAGMLAGGRAVLLDLADRPELRAAAAPWQPRLAVHTARCAEHPELSAMLVRPDGHVAWIDTAHVPAHGTGASATGGTADPGRALRHALGVWLGEPAHAPDPAV